MNKTIIVWSAACLVAGAGGYGAYWLGLQHGKNGATVTAATGAMTASDADDKIDPATGKRVLYWHDPMVPGQRFDKPGKSPFMDMQLVPVYADASAADGGIAIDNRVVQNLGMRTAEVAMGRLEASLQVPGNVTVNERSINVIQARTAGFVVSTAVKAALDSVKRGQVLVSLYSPEWVAAQEEYLAVARAPEQAGLVSAARARMLQVGMTEGQVRAISTSGKISPHVAITSPADGYVMEIGVRDGMSISPGMTLFRIADLSTVWVLAEVPENQSAQIRIGQPVKVVAADNARELDGKVDAILPDISQGTRTLKVRVVLQNRERQLVPGMFTSVRFSMAATQDTLLIPTEALIRTGTRTLVMAATPQGGYAPVEIRPGRESRDMTEVLGGLKAGDKVVVSGQFLVDSEASLRGTAARADIAPGEPQSAAPAAPDAHQGLGKIESVTKDSLTISHGPIPSLQWGAMTMEFMAPVKGLPQGLKVGQQIRFRFTMGADGVPVLTAVEPQASTEGRQP